MTRITKSTIDTPNLRLHPYSPADLLALIKSQQEFERQFGLAADDGLREFIVSDEVSPAWLSQLRASAEADIWLHGFAVVHRKSNSVIGSASFKGPPDSEAMVEIAYGIVPGRRGNGYATETAMALVAFAFGDGGARLARAHTAPHPNASTRVLMKCGFQYIDEVDDPEDGPVWRWERTKESARTGPGFACASHSTLLDCRGDTSNGWTP